MAASRKLGVLVAIPIKGRKLINKTGRKQSPYVQLKLGDQKKRTKASLIASVEPEWDQEVRLDVFQGALDMYVAVYDEGRKSDLIGDGILLLHEVVDKGELDVWFPIKCKGAPAGDIYFELTFYAVAPPPAAGVAPLPQHTQNQHPQIRHSQPGFVPAGRPLPHAPMTTLYGNMPGPPAPFAGNTYQHPAAYANNINARPYPLPQHHPYTPPQPPARPGFVQGFTNTSPAFRPTTQYSGSGHHPNIPGSSSGGPIGFSGPGPRPFPAQGNPPIRHPMAQQSPPAGQQYAMPRPMPHPVAGGYRPTPQGNRPPIGVPHNARPPPGAGPVPPITPLMQYNYTLGSFP
ncbi:hypothetical protein BGZ70_002251 [Mortierella alpina]|uniref:C2 domain-containing protein n=1 Tax=Mortierella alpina TaxID=64518 RepID=A0A9P6JB53_MORAP|nr:hypothetical protein BGZ70_002251 [Mortierella alpina]